MKGRTYIKHSFTRTKGSENRFNFSKNFDSGRQEKSLRNSEAR